MNDLIRGLFDDALSEFLSRDTKLLDRDTSERTICGRLAMYLERLAHGEGLKEYYADIDYNRNLGEVKRIIGRRPNEGKLIVADLILHSRAEQEPDNLIAVEVKKDYRHYGEKDDDRYRLRTITQPKYDELKWPPRDGVPYVFGYRLGIYLEILSQKRTLLIEEYRNGEQVKIEERPFVNEQAPEEAIALAEAASRPPSTPRPRTRARRNRH